MALSMTKQTQSCDRGCVNITLSLTELQDCLLPSATASPGRLNRSSYLSLSLSLSSLPLSSLPLSLSLHDAQPD